MLAQTKLGITKNEIQMAHCKKKKIFISRLFCFNIIIIIIVVIITLLLVMSKAHLPPTVLLKQKQISKAMLL